MTQTPHFGFDEIRPGESLSDNQHKFSTVDRRLMDLLFFILFRHHHNGEQNAAVALSAPLELELDQTAGALPAGQRIYFKYTLVDENGIESLPSPEAFIDTPAAIAAPSAPAWQFLNTGGALLPGQYTYVLSAYKDASTLESEARAFTSVSVAGTATTNKITLTLPTLPAGADGFNVYRRKPGATAYAFLATIDMTVATPPTDFVDDGSITEDPNRVAPSSNTTNQQNSVVVSLPGATPIVPDGYTWRLYRSLISGVYTSSLVHHVVEQTSEGSGVVLPEWTDLGAATIAESPPTTAFPIGNPDPIELIDGAEVHGVLPPANIVFRDVIRWRTPVVVNEIAQETWTCPYDVALVAFSVISLGRDSVASVQPDIVDIVKYDAQLATPVWATIYTDQTKRPRIEVGDYVSDNAVPDVQPLFKGDRLSYEIEEGSGMATPTDEDLLIEVHIYYWDLTATTVAQPTP